MATGYGTSRLPTPREGTSPSGSATARARSRPRATPACGWAVVPCCCPPATWILTTDVMTWALIPWLWQADPRSEVVAARQALQRVARFAQRPLCAAIFVTPHGQSGPRTHLPRLRLASAEASGMAVGVITWRELADVFDEATREVPSVRGRDAASYGAQQLALLTQAAAG